LIRTRIGQTGVCRRRASLVGYLGSGMGIDGGDGLGAIYGRVTCSGRGRARNRGFGDGRGGDHDAH